MFQQRGIYNMKIIVSRITGIEEVNFDMRKVNDNDADIIMKTVEKLSKSRSYHKMQYMVVKMVFL